VNKCERKGVGAGFHRLLALHLKKEEEETAMEKLRSLIQIQICQIELNIERPWYN